MPTKIGQSPTGQSLRNFCFTWCKTWYAISKGDTYTHLTHIIIYNKKYRDCYCPWNSVQCYVAALIGGECGEECMHMAESLSRSPETITALLISYTPIQYEKFTIKQNIYIYIWILWMFKKLRDVKTQMSFNDWYFKLYYSSHWYLMY